MIVQGAVDGAGRYSQGFGDVQQLGFSGHGCDRGGIGALLVSGDNIPIFISWPAPAGGEP
jgi:hypothetical protein